MLIPKFLNLLSETYPPRPDFTEKDVPELTGKVYVVTGGSSGVGKELARILYAKHASIYVATRSREKAMQAIDDIKAAVPLSNGRLEFVELDLADLSTIKLSAKQILDQEQKIHVLFNNAGVFMPPPDQKTPQGYEQQLGVHNLGHFLFTKFLVPTLLRTAKEEPANTVRVIWVGSSAGETVTPQGGVPMDNLDYRVDTYNLKKYGISKAGNYLQGAEMARRYQADGLISISINPGNLQSELWRGQGPLITFLLNTVLLYPVINGAYTELFAGLSPEVTMAHSGGWIVPWGRFMEARKDLEDATRPKEEGGSGIAKEFWEWNEKQVRAYL